MATRITINQIRTTESNQAIVKYRKPLNEQQVEILRALVTFRFVTKEQLAAIQQRPYVKAIEKRLKILEAQGLIAKRYHKSYKLRGKPAAYYLTPAGARTLQRLSGQPLPELKAITNLYRNKQVSEAFIDHYIAIVAVYVALQARYHDQLTFTTKSSLSLEDNDSYPQPLPDAHIRLTTETGGRSFFLTIH